MALRAADNHGARLVGLKLSQNPYDCGVPLAEDRDDVEFGMMGWEEFDGQRGPIVSFGPLERS